MTLDLEKTQTALRDDDVAGVREALTAAGVAFDPDPAEVFTSALDAVQQRFPDAYDALVRSTFTTLAKDARGKERAWRMLNLKSEAAGVGSVQVGKAYYERELQRMGPVLAWRDSKVTVQRSLSKPGAVHLRVLEPSAIDAFIASEHGAANVEWAQRRADVTSLKDARDAVLAMIGAGDADALRAHLDRFLGVKLPLLDRNGRIWLASACDPSRVLDDCVRHGEHVAPIAVVMARGPIAHDVHSAAAVAISRDRRDLLEAILDGAPDFDLDHESMGDTLLSLVCRERRTAMVELLLARGAKPTPAVRNSFVTHARAPDDGNGPLLNAVRNGDAALVALLLAAGADPLGKTVRGRRILDVAHELGDPEVLALFAASEANAPVKDLREACATLDVERILELLPESGPVEPVLAAAQAGHTELLRRVCDRAELDAKLAAKAVWFSAQNGHLANIELLLARGFDPNGYAGSGRESARKTAKDRGHTAIEAALKAAGGKLTKPKKPS